MACLFIAVGNYCCKNHSKSAKHNTTGGEGQWNLLKPVRRELKQISLVALDMTFLKWRIGSDYKIDNKSRRSIKIGKGSAFGFMSNITRVELTNTYLGKKI